MKSFHFFDYKIISDIQESSFLSLSNLPTDMMKDFFLQAYQENLATCQQEQIESIKLIVCHLFDDSSSLVLPLFLEKRDDGVFPRSNSNFKSFFNYQTDKKSQNIHGKTITHVLPDGSIFDMKLSKSMASRWIDMYSLLETIRQETQTRLFKEHLEQKLPLHSHSIRKKI